MAEGAGQALYAGGGPEVWRLRPYATGMSLRILRCGKTSNRRHREVRLVNWIFELTMGAYNLVRLKNLGVLAPSG
ncbi:MAG: hypothetical protein ACUVXB_18050 [Bryobacteraceae bacterium]